MTFDRTRATLPSTPPCSRHSALWPSSRGALLGGLIATAAPVVVDTLPFLDGMRSPLFIVFVASFALRVAVSVWFIPRAAEPRTRKRPRVLQVIYRVSRFSAISGIALDWLSVTRRAPRKGQASVEDDEVP